MSPWRDERITNKERWSYSANGPWKAEIEKIEADN